MKNIKHEINIIKRTGAKNRASIPQNILTKLNNGTEQTASLSEALAINFIDLLSSVYPQHKQKIELELEGIANFGILKKMTSSAQFIQKQFPKSDDLIFQFDLLSTHNSDTIRGISCYLLSYIYTDINLSLNKMYNLANDPHFSVREWAWLALRNQVILQFKESLSTLYQYSQDNNENIRRFVSEISRPRGVWCSHINILKHNIDNSLDLCKPILNNLQADSSRYVQNSVGNWLNDCAKSQEEWVKNLCSNWNDNIKETKFIIKRGYRNLK